MSRRRRPAAPAKVAAPRRWKRTGLWLLASLAIAAGLIVSLPRAWSSRPVRDRRAAFRLSRARSLLAEGKPAPARGQFREALRLKPAFLEARRALAALEQQLGNPELAFFEFESLAELHPEVPDGWMGLAPLMIQQGWLEAPEAALDKVVDLDPARADARALRAEVRLRLGRRHGALLDAEAAAASPATAASARATLAAISGNGAEARVPAPPRHLRPPEIEVGSLHAWAREVWPGRLAEQRQRLEVQLEAKAWQEALGIVASVRASYPGSLAGPAFAGLVELARGDAVAAERELAEALSIAPRNPTVAAALGRAWAAQQGAAYAARRFAELAEADPSFGLARYLAARAYVEARDPVHAESVLRRGLERQPDSPEPYRQLADYYFGLDRAPEALEICATGVGRFPRDVALSMMLAQIDESVGRTEDAEKTYQAVLSARPDLDLVEYRLGMLLAAQGSDATRAAKILDDLHDDSPSDPTLADTLGWLEFRAGHLRRAEERLLAAVQVLPQDPRPRFHLASVYARENRQDLAVPQLREALASGRPFAERLEAMRLLRDSRPAKLGAAP